MKKGGEIDFWTGFGHEILYENVVCSVFCKYYLRTNLSQSLRGFIATSVRKHNHHNLLFR